MPYLFKKIESYNLRALTDFFAKNHGTEFFDPFPLNAESAKHIATVDNINFYFGIFDSERIIGFGMLRWHKDYQSPTLGLLVDKDHRGEGLGTKIYEYLFQVAKEKKCPEIIAIVHKNNLASAHIAKKLFMKEIDRKNSSIKNHYNFSEYIKNNQEKLIFIKKFAPKVSVCIITYNHGKFIAEAIEGVLKQKTDFPFELIIADDCSTDNTGQIIKFYAEKHPNIIKPIYREKNIGMMENFVSAILSCQGEYIALCEGDDYWTNPLKLQKQIDFLDSHPDYTICGHNVNIIYDDANIRKELPEIKADKTFDLKYLLEYGSGGATCSLVFRNKIFGEFPDWYKLQKGGDWTLQILCATKGKMKFFKEKMATYRKHDKGAKFNLKEDVKAQGKSDFALIPKYGLAMVATLNKYFNYKYDKELRKQSTYWYHLYINEYLKINDIKTAKKYAVKILKEILPLHYWKNTWLTKKEFLKLLALAVLPNFLIGIIKK